jgi:hypothetical protein
MVDIFVVVFVLVVDRWTVVASMHLMKPRARLRSDDASDHNGDFELTVQRLLLKGIRPLDWNKGTPTHVPSPFQD